jgi:hypothetical protein
VNTRAWIAVAVVALLVLLAGTAHLAFHGGVPAHVHQMLSSRP